MRRSDSILGASSRLLCRQILQNADYLCHRRPAAHKAWSGPNPITQRSSTPNQGKGNAQQNKTASSSKMALTKEHVQTDKHNYDRIRYLFGAAVVCLSSIRVEARH